MVRATGPVGVTHHPAGGEAALAVVRRRVRRRPTGAPARGRRPTVWCSWYHYFEQVTAADIEENLRAIDELALAVDVVQIDDGWSPGLGEGLAPSPDFGSLPALVDAIRASGRRAGLWLAPFLVGTPDHAGPRAPRLAGGPGRPQLGSGPRRPRPHPSRRAGAAARRARPAGRPGRGLPQARLPLRRSGARPAARRRGRGGGLPRRAGAGPRGGRAGRLPRRLRGTAAARASDWWTRCASRPTPSTRAPRTAPPGCAG